MQITSDAHNQRINRNDDSILIYPGITLYDRKVKDADTMIITSPDTEDSILYISHCKSGHVSWNNENGKQISLHPGDVSLMYMNPHEQFILSFPDHHYEGITLSFHLRTLSDLPLLDQNSTNQVIHHLYEKANKNHPMIVLEKCNQSEAVFNPFYDRSNPWLDVYRKLKVVELLLYLDQSDVSGLSQIGSYKEEQIEIMKQIHEYLIHHMDQRITIETLSKQYLINPTTLKAAFKSVYGTSIAAHIKEHRMKYAASLLCESDTSIAEIAKMVGYDSQSKFSIAFKAYYQVLPKEYRKQNKSHARNG